MQLFQCQPTSDDSGLVYTPNIPDFNFDDMNAANSRSGVTHGANLIGITRGVTYIFTIPSESSLRNCSGSVVSLQYCYQARYEDIGRRTDVFRFLSLVQNGLQFTINSSIIIQSTPWSNICSNPPGTIEQICCDSTPLSCSEQFQITSSSFAYGVVTGNKNVQPLAFAISATKYRVEQFQVSLGDSVQTPGTIFTLSGSSLVNDHSLLLLRFNTGTVLL